MVQVTNRNSQSEKFSDGDKFPDNYSAQDDYSYFWTFWKNKFHCISFMAVSTEFDVNIWERNISHVFHKLDTC